jgi:hypothetical protein
MFDFLFVPVHATPLALLRILVGVVCLANLLLFVRDKRIWLDTTLARYRNESRYVDLFRFISWTPRNTGAILIAGIASSLFLILGVGSSVAAFATYFTLASLHCRCGYVLYGGDILLRVMLLWLALVDCGASVSFDRYISSGDPWGEGAAVPAYHLYFLWLQVSTVYICSGIQKARNPPWRSGRALYYSARHRGVSRLSLRMQDLISLPIARVFCWATIVAEIVLPLLLWTSHWWIAAAALAVFHVVIHLVLSVYLFSAIMLACLSVFVRFPLHIAESAPIGSGFSAAMFLLLSALVIAYPLVRRAQSWLRPLLFQFMLEHRWNMFLYPEPSINNFSIRISAHNFSENRTIQFDWEESECPQWYDPIRHRHRRMATVLARDSCGEIREEFYEYVACRIAKTYGIMVDAIGITIFRQRFAPIPPAAFPSVREIAPLSFHARTSSVCADSDFGFIDLYVCWILFGRDSSIASARIHCVLFLFLEAAGVGGHCVLPRLRFIFESSDFDHEAISEDADLSSVVQCADWSGVAAVDPASDWPQLYLDITSLSSVASDRVIADPLLLNLLNNPQRVSTG